MNDNVAKLRYHGTGGSLLGLVLVNALLALITFGIYGFWARNKVREFHYSHTEMSGDRFAYHGTGGELFRGYLKAMGILFLLALAYGVLSAILAAGLGEDPQSPALLIGMPLAINIAVGILIILAVNGARRYRFSRSSWRGIRFSYLGEFGAFLKLMLRGIGLSVVTLGIYTPFFESDRRAFLVSNARFGSEPFSYDGEGRALFGEFLKAVLLTIPTLGLYWVWYAAFKHRYFWNHTTMRGGRFESTVAGGELLSLTLTNLLLVIFTLGIGASWAVTRTHAFWCDRVTLYSTVDWATIQQRAQTADATGEGLAEGFDVDVGLGM